MAQSLVGERPLSGSTKWGTRAMSPTWHLMGSGVGTGWTQRCCLVLMSGHLGEAVPPLGCPQTALSAARGREGTAE